MLQHCIYVNGGRRNSNGRQTINQLYIQGTEAIGRKLLTSSFKSPLGGSRWADGTPIPHQRKCTVLYANAQNACQNNLIFPFRELFLPLKNNNLRVIAKKILRDFWSKYPDCEQQLKAWYKESEDANWKNPNEIKREYPSASILEDNRIVFNIKGNKYRLIVKINFHYQMLWIRFIGIHSQYDKIGATKI